MKNTIYMILFIIGLVACLQGCDKTAVGYLKTDNAVYTPDSLVVKAVLDVVEDAEQIEKEMPYQSGEIQQVSGTDPKEYLLNAVHTDNGFIGAEQQIRIVQKGKIQIEYNHTLPVGIYVLDIEVRNEGHAQILKSVFRVIVQ